MKTILRFLLSIICCSSKAAVSFDGANDIAATVTNGYSGPNPVTISCWVNVAGAHESGIGMIIERTGLSATRGWLCYVTDAGAVVFQATYATAAISKTLPAATIPSGKWTHLAATWAGTTSTNDLTLYVNGVATNSAGAVTGSGAWVADPALQFCIGNRFSTTLTFNGQIAEMAVWTNALSASEVALLAQPRVTRLPLIIRPQSLIAYWPMDGGPDGTAVTPVNCLADLSGRGNHASPTNSPTWRPSPNSYP